MIPLQIFRLSKPAPSTTRPPLLKVYFYKEIKKTIKIKRIITCASKNGKIKAQPPKNIKNIIKENNNNNNKWYVKPNEICVILFV